MAWLVLSVLTNNMSQILSIKGTFLQEEKETVTPEDKVSERDQISFASLKLIVLSLSS